MLKAGDKVIIPKDMRFHSDDKIGTDIVLPEGTIVLVEGITASGCDTRLKYEGFGSSFHYIHRPDSNLIKIGEFKKVTSPSFTLSLKTGDKIKALVDITDNGVSIQKGDIYTVGFLYTIDCVLSNGNDRYIVDYCNITSDKYEIVKEEENKLAGFKVGNKLKANKTFESITACNFYKNEIYEIYEIYDKYIVIGVSPYNLFTIYLEELKNFVFDYVITKKTDTTTSAHAIKHEVLQYRDIMPGVYVECIEAFEDVRIGERFKIMSYIGSYCFNASSLDTGKKWWLNFAKNIKNFKKIGQTEPATNVKKDYTTGTRTNTNSFIDNPKIRQLQTQLNIQMHNTFPTVKALGENLSQKQAQYNYSYLRQQNNNSQLDIAINDTSDTWKMLAKTNTPFDDIRPQQSDLQDPMVLTKPKKNKSIII